LGISKEAAKTIVNSAKSTDRTRQQFGYGSILIVVLILAFLSSTQAQGSFSEPNREQLLNGLTVLFSPRPGDANVFLKLRIHSGAAFDLTGKAGTMALLGDALFPDPATREYVSEQLGGRLDVSTTYDSIDVTISGKASELERMIELLRTAVLSTDLSVENVARLREARLKQSSENPPSPSLIADREIAKRLFGSFPYGNPATGTVESLAKVERGDLMLAVERFLHSDNATLVVIGGVDRLRLMRDLRQLLGPWPKGDRTYPSTFRQPNPPDARVLIVDGKEAKNAEVRIAVRGLARSDRDTLAASLLAQIARERWHASVPDISNAFVRHDAYLLPGMFVFGGSTQSASAGKAISAAAGVMKALVQNGPTAAELDQARAVMMTEMNKLSASPNSLASTWLDSETYKLPNANSSAELNRLTAGDLQRVATRLFKDTPQATIAVGDTAQLKVALGDKVEIRNDAKTSADSAAPTRKP
jgi:predicted Zn-dependent peptidase